MSIFQGPDSDQIVVTAGMSQTLDEWCARYDMINRLPLSVTDGERIERDREFSRLLGQASAIMHDLRAAVRRAPGSPPYALPPIGFETSDHRS